MAGYVKLFRSIWNDPDFRALTRGQQQLYMLLISQQDLSNVGVLSASDIAPVLGACVHASK